MRIVSNFPTFDVVKKIKKMFFVIKKTMALDTPDFGVLIYYTNFLHY